MITQEVPPIIPAAQARARLTEILSLVKSGPVVISKDGEPAAVVLSPDVYNQLVALLETYSSPQVRADIAEYERDQDDGTVQTFDLADVERELMLRRGKRPAQP